MFNLSSAESERIGRGPRRRGELSLRLVTTIIFFLSLTLSAQTALIAEGEASPADDRQAQSLERAQELVVKARTAASRGSYRESIKLFEAAQDILPAPDNLFAIASIYERIEGACQQALEAWARFETLCIDCTLRAKGLGRLKSLETQCAVKLTIDSTPTGALVTLDGESKGATPITIPSVAGRHTLTLHLEGYHPVKEALILLKGSQVDVKSVVLNPLQKTLDMGTITKTDSRIERGQNGRANPMPSADLASSAKTSLYAPMAESDMGQRKNHTPAIIMLTSGVILTALGAWSYLSARDEADAINRASSPLELERASSASNIATKETLGYVGMGLGLGLSAFGAIKFSF